MIGSDGKDNEVPLQCKYLLTALKSNAYRTLLDVLNFTGKDVTFLGDSGTAKSRGSPLGMVLTCTPTIIPKKTQDTHAFMSILNAASLLLK